MSERVELESVEWVTATLQHGLFSLDSSINRAKLLKCQAQATVHQIMLYAQSQPSTVPTKGGLLQYWQAFFHTPLSTITASTNGYVQCCADSDAHA